MKKILKTTVKSGSVKLAFTYIELIVVVTIITLLSSTGVFYFLDFTKNQELSQKVNNIQDRFKDLEKKIKDYSLYDYEIQLNTNTGALGYLEYINNYDIPYNQYVYFDSKTGSGRLWTNGNNSLKWNLKIYKNIKLYISEGIQSDINYYFLFNDSESYKIIGTLTGNILNEININYFTEDNIYPEKNNLLILSSINTKQDKSGTDILNLIIKNIGGNKSIIGDGLNINDVYLFFDSNGKEEFIRIKK